MDMLVNETIAEKKQLILVADDDLGVQLLLQRVLEREGFQIEFANDGPYAVQRARELFPDLVLMDVRMPQMDGFEVVRVLREDARTGRIPIIFLTAKALEPNDVVRGLNLGADDYVRKPFNRGELVARVRNLIRQRKLEEEL